jgi:hypothetical protein
MYSHYVEPFSSMGNDLAPYCPGAAELAALQATNADLRFSLEVVMLAMWAFMVAEACAILRPSEDGQGVAAVERLLRKVGWPARVLWVGVVVLLAPAFCVWHTVWLLFAGWRVRSVCAAVGRRWGAGGMPRRRCGIDRVLAATALNRAEREALLGEMEAAAAPTGRMTWAGVRVLTLSEKGAEAGEERKPLLVDEEANQVVEV